MYTREQIASIAMQVRVAVPPTELCGAFDNLKISFTLEHKDSFMGYQDGIYFININRRASEKRREKLLAECLGHLILHTCFLTGVEEIADFSLFNSGIKGRKGIEANVFAFEYLNK